MTKSFIQDLNKEVYDESILLKDNAKKQLSNALTEAKLNFQILFDLNKFLYTPKYLKDFNNTLATSITKTMDDSITYICK